MRSPATIFPLIVLAAFILSAHGGGLDRNGCHNDRKRGGYHCHRGPLAGQTFISKDEAIPSAPASPLRTQNIIRGVTSVIDGDTIHIGETRIRLHGIDAPESRQTCIAEGGVWVCGQMATQALVNAIKGQEVKCRGNKRDRYKRLLAVCYVGDINLNAMMVSNGWALAYRKYSRDFIDIEAVAEKSRLGLWRGDFVKPWEWRQGKRLSVN